MSRTGWDSSFTPSTRSISTFFASRIFSRWPWVRVRFLPRDWPGLKSRWLWPPIVCGQHSLEIFCLGVFLSFAAHFAIVEISGAVWMQFLLSGLGIIIMVAVAGLLTWYKRAEGRSP